MECRRQLDAACSSAVGHPLICAASVFLLLACYTLPGTAQPILTDGNLLTQIEQLSAEERWQEIVRLAEAAPTRSTELDYYYGIALARLERWDEARSVFQAGSRARPGDKRFPLELAGIAFKQKHYTEAVANLRRALGLDPTDSYGNDFLGSVYFLEGNLEAALKYWNRIGKPQIEELRMEPKPRVDPVLLDRAFAFSPASTLRLPELLTSKVRIRGLEIFPSYRIDLAARHDGKFDAVFRSQERNGWGASTLQGLIGLFRGLPYQTINPEFLNIGGSGLNFVSLVRWDSEKRRVLASVSGPLHRDPKRRYCVSADLRNENWDIRNSFSGPAPLLAALNLRREAAAAEITSFSTGRWNWSTGAEFSHRDFRSVLPGIGLTPELLLDGYQLKHTAQFNYELWRIPERRFTIESGTSSQVGRIWSQPAHAFAKLQGSLLSQWYPLSRGDDYETHWQLRAGRTFGDLPFDELSMLGMERDNDLWLRAHIGTRNGRKGSAPLGRNYFLSNWEMDKNVYQNGLFNLRLGPFLDTGKITPSAALGSKKWLWDVGVQAKLRVLGVSVGVSYGKDLRSGNNAFYTTVGR